MNNENRIFALGFFDGVHLGHQALLRQCCALAAQENCQPAALTFDTHPGALLRGAPPVLLNTPEDRLRLLRRGLPGKGKGYRYEAGTRSCVQRKVLGVHR